MFEAMALNCNQISCHSFFYDFAFPFFFSNKLLKIFFQKKITTFFFCSFQLKFFANYVILVILTKSIALHYIAQFGLKSYSNYNKIAIKIFSFEKVFFFCYRFKIGMNVMVQICCFFFFQLNHFTFTCCKYFQCYTL